MRSLYTIFRYVWIGKLREICEKFETESDEFTRPRQERVRHHLERQRYRLLTCTGLTAILKWQ